jgi:hypothetical protein
LSFIKYFIQHSLIAGGGYSSRNTEYLIPHGFEVFSKVSNDALFVASTVRKSLLETDSFPNLFDDRYLTYVGYTWLQAYLDANPVLNETVDNEIRKHFSSPFSEHFRESGLWLLNDDQVHFIVNTKKGGSFRLYDKNTGCTYSDSGILVSAEGRWYTSGWLTDAQYEMTDNAITVSGNMWRVPDRTLTPLRNILLRFFQLTFGRSSAVSLWIKERLRDILITKTKPASIRHKRTLILGTSSQNLLVVKDMVFSGNASISSVSVYNGDTYIYVPSSRYYVVGKDPSFQKDFGNPVGKIEINWKIERDGGLEFDVGN